MADKVEIPAVPPATAPGPTIKIKTHSARDGLDGLPVEIQAITLVNEQGQPVNPISEETGREILEMLRSINNILADAFNGIQQ